MKHISSNFKQGIKIGMLVALIISMAMTTGCEMPNGGTTIENPGNGTNPGNEQDNPGNQGGSGNEQENPGKEYSTPYDIALGNGNYVIHNFIGATDDLEYTTFVDDTNHYLGLAETYVKGKANDLSDVVNGRTNYFDDYINEVANDNHYHIDAGFTRGQNFDRAINSIASDPAEIIFTDIINNLGSKAKRRAFTCLYRAMANEAFKANLGILSSNSTQSIEYENEKQDIIDTWNTSIGTLKNEFDIAQDYNNNFVQITQFSDQLLGEAVAKMDNGVTVEDLQKVVNLSLTANALQGMHERTKGNLNHQESNCILSVGIVTAMEIATDLANLSTKNPVQINQEQGLSL